ncbi:class I SAM-dependent methyltransferase [Vaginisenegalia massiliensis]|uniref:class I SAM-dependent methyltransferase n=1 Tax=Vaginisenegalia massiliensis TaxID=2058294 RepID=UPI000F53CD30|nr:methyltransferase [Vaginisenegalia massiliensis]
MTDHYYSHQPESDHQERTIQFSIQDQSLQFVTDRGVFSKDRVDYGSNVLLKAFLDHENTQVGQSLLELGSGYGPILISLAKLAPQLHYVGVEVNQRSLDLAIRNQALNKVSNIDWHLADATQIDLNQFFDYAITNPPIRAGKKTIQAFVNQAYRHIKVGGRLFVVIQKKQGAESMKKYMDQVFGQAERISLDKGYWVLMSQKED